MRSSEARALRAVRLRVNALHERLDEAAASPRGMRDELRSQALCAALGDLDPLLRSSGISPHDRARLSRYLDALQAQVSALFGALNATGGCQRLRKAPMRALTHARLARAEYVLLTAWGAR